MTNHNQSGQLLLEALVAISAAAIVIVIGAQLVYVSMQSNKVAGERGVAMGLMTEASEAIKASAVEKWQNVFSLTKGSASYYPENSSGRWVLTSGAESVIINDITYTRSFTVQNVCRNTATLDITGVADSSGADTTCITNGGSYDPSTQKITTTISWPGADALSSSEYITRWMNKVCAQTSWSSTGSSTQNCPATTYESSTNITTGDNLQLCSGC